MYLVWNSARCLQWRQREFKVGGDEAPKGWGVGERSGEGAVPPPQKIFCFVISKWHILVNSEVVNLKFFFSQQL